MPQEKQPAGIVFRFGSDFGKSYSLLPLRYWRPWLNPRLVAFKNSCPGILPFVIRVYTFYDDFVIYSYNCLVFVSQKTSTY